jgi:hypothetical protein
MQEISAETRTELEKRYRTAVFVVIAQILTALLLTVAAFFIAQTFDNSVTSESISALWFTVLFIAVGAFLLRRFLFNWERLKNTAVIKGVSGVLQTLQTNSILLGSLGEIIVIIGFLVAALGGNKWDMFRAAAVALIVFLANFPRRSTWEKIVANLEKI